MKSFAESGLKKELLKSLERINFVSPTPIQHQSINHLLQSDRDMIGMAHTGTGKTAAFALPIIHRTHLEIKEVQTIVLCPTRELCLQITNDIKNYTRDLRSFQTVAVYGGASMTQQISALKKGCHLVVGTPGRTLDLINRNKLRLHQVRWLVLDEADEMLSMGFKDELDQILTATPADKQTLLFSATMPATITSIAENYMTDPHKILVEPHEKTKSNITHGYFLITRKSKFEFLRYFISLHKDIYAIIFCRTRKDTSKLASDLSEEGYQIDALHGDLNQRQRDRVLNRFRKRSINLLVATDVAARGLDVTDLTHVINFNLPDEPEAYVHRSGRTGRAGKEGNCICLLEKKELKKLHFISHKTGIKFQESKLPGKEEIVREKIDSTVEQILTVENVGHLLTRALPEIDQKLFHLSRQELIGRFFSILLRKDLPQVSLDKGHHNAGKIDQPKINPNTYVPDELTGSEEYTRYYINLGTKHQLDKSALISLINRKLKGDDFRIGKIEMLKSFSFFEIEAGLEKRVLSGFKGAEFEGISLVTEIATSKPTPPSPNRKKKKKKKKKKFF
ncbi:MAG: DEAD/DEAH box helicase [Saprospiraceae bacterium]|nr:DEAD/DEAH box helicase [Saprospiraceae bacterium]